MSADEDLIDFAKRWENDPDKDKFFDFIEGKIHDDWASSKNARKREACYSELQALKRVRNQLTRISRLRRKTLGGM